MLPWLLGTFFCQDSAPSSTPDKACTAARLHPRRRRRRWLLLPLPCGPPDPPSARSSSECLASASTSPGTPIRASLRPLHRLVAGVEAPFAKRRTPASFRCGRSCVAPLLLLPWTSALAWACWSLPLTSSSSATSRAQPLAPLTMPAHPRPWAASTDNRQGPGASSPASLLHQRAEAHGEQSPRSYALLGRLLLRPILVFFQLCEFFYFFSKPVL